MRRSTHIFGLTMLALAIAAALIGSAAWREGRRGVLTVSFLDVGQGDAIFIDAPSGRQALIDGGPGGIVVRRLGREMPWYDRSIDVVIPTHPDADHVAGLVPVLARYRVSHIVVPAVEGDTATAAGLMQTIAGEGAQRINAARGQIIDLGGGAYLEVLFPDRALPHAETNTACTVTRLVYGETAFLLPCDAPRAVEDYLVSLDGARLHADVLKAGHHGSKTSSSLAFVGVVDPAWVVYSRGCGNTYGFPHRETIDTYARFSIPVADTCTDGTITFKSDGRKVWRE